jgi:O-antigen ligase
MIVRTPRYQRAVPVNPSGQVPPGATEFAYYSCMFYAYLGDASGISLPMLGVGMLGLLAVYCVMLDGPRLITAYRPIAFALSCAASYIAVQVIFHGEPLMADYVRDFAPWMLTLIVVHALSRREGFLERFAIAALALGLAVLPLLKFWGAGSELAVRAGLDRALGTIGGLANSNALAEWFGFCCICFTITGIESKRNSIRAISWLVAIGCLFVVGLTVSRGTLVALAVAIIIASRRLLKRGFLPLLALFIVIWLTYLLGLFEQAATSYGARGLEETGRLLVWPIDIGRFAASPFIGVGASDVASYVPRADKWITPHNSFIFIALASGVVPFIFFVAYWMRAASGAYRSSAEQHGDAPFLFPLLVYAFLTSHAGNMTFMSPWMIVTMVAAIKGGSVSRATRTAMVSGRTRDRMAGRSKFGAGPRYHPAEHQLR